mgnify:CR=1 FL=1
MFNLSSRSLSPTVFYQKNHHIDEKDSLEKSHCESHRQDHSTESSTGQHDFSDPLDTKIVYSTDETLKTTNVLSISGKND